MIAWEKLTYQPTNQPYQDPLQANDGTAEVWMSQNDRTYHAMFLAFLVHVMKSCLNLWASRRSVEVLVSNVDKTFILWKIAKAYSQY